mmetsp:Transcript_19953/g.28063  ORF Transcript_19953/g.28063 Transcript_19953/m.28063 type:complete len:231 (+) Transcript_19953:109-801(+)
MRPNALRESSSKRSVLILRLLHATPKVEKRKNRPQVARQQKNNNILDAEEVRAAPTRFSLIEKSEKGLPQKPASRNVRQVKTDQMSIKKVHRASTHNSLKGNVGYLFRLPQKHPILHFLLKLKPTTIHPPPNHPLVLLDLILMEETASLKCSTHLEETAVMNCITHLEEPVEMRYSAPINPLNPEAEVILNYGMTSLFIAEGAGTPLIFRMTGLLTSYLSDQKLQGGAPA